MGTEQYKLCILLHLRQHLSVWSVPGKKKNPCTATFTTSPCTADTTTENTTTTDTVALVTSIATAWDAASWDTTAMDTTATPGITATLVAMAMTTTACNMMTTTTRPPPIPNIPETLTITTTALDTKS